VVEGNLAGQSFPLGEAPLTIGRAPDSTLVLSDDYVSTHHARLVPTGTAWVLEDLGSTNGTYLDRQKVSTPTPVPVGVAIRVGKTVMELRR
jgi:pSer/pThr/pTyr-binding forkhead associated (FHA) protein